MMKLTQRTGPFQAEITGSMLSVSRCENEERGAPPADYFTARGVSMLFFCSLRKIPWFVVHSDGLYAQNAHDALTPLYRGDDAAQLLMCIRDVLQARALKTLLRRWLTGASVAALCVTAWLALAPAQAPFTAGTPGAGVPVTLPLNAATHMPASPVPSRGNVPAVPPAGPADGWALTADKRAALPGRLKKAHERGLFTVPLSSGHARTLYVFADPECPNCQRMEQHLETASGTVNVVIFPVTIAGRDSSLKSLTPVLMLPESERAAAWKQLFTADAGIAVPGAVPPAAAEDDVRAETARGAIGVNEVAFRSYRLPGTPWTILDDGRYVPQTVLSSPAALAAFLNGGSDE